MFITNLLMEDPSLGRFDRSSLTQQTLLELFIDGIARNKERICGIEEAPKDISEWKKVTLDSHGAVTHIDWYGQQLGGSVDFQWLPSSLIQLLMHSNGLTAGTLDLTTLPPDMYEMYLSTNLFTGPINLTSLPGKMSVLAMSYNELVGSVDLTHLPNAMIRLFLNNNNFSGTLCFTHLPPGMISINLANNGFSGFVDTSKFPKSLVSLAVKKTELEGDFSVLPIRGW